MKTKVDTTGWEKFEFEWKGYRFISSISYESPLLEKVLNLPAGIFQEMNKQALDALTQDGESIEEALERINKNGTHAIIELA